jgi:GTPase SAR1 family protein
MTFLVGQDSVWKECMEHLNTPSHIFLTGPAGSGKTTLMRAFLRYYAELKQRPHSDRWGLYTTDECLLLGPEQDRGIQTIRGQVSLFIRQMAIGQDIFRWVIIDDVDSFPQISQQALRRPMESYSHITRFLFIGTSEEDLIPALRSRCIHIKMNTVDIYQERLNLLKYIGMPETGKMTDEMWNWVINISGNNMSDLIRLVSLIRDVHYYQKMPLTISLVRTLCSAPFYMNFIPLLNMMTEKNILGSIKCLIQIWKKGYAYEDILESFQQINQLFGTSVLSNNILIHQFLIQAWISYCKGNTSLLALQHIVYRVLSSAK